MYQMRIGCIWALSLLMNTFSQSSQQKIPDCLDKSSSCLTDRWWDRFLDTRIPRTTENECGKNWVSHKSYNQMKLLCTICANETLSSQKRKTKQNESHPISSQRNRLCLWNHSQIFDFVLWLQAFKHWLMGFRLEPQNSFWSVYCEINKHASEAEN